MFGAAFWLHGHLFPAAVALMHRLERRSVDVHFRARGMIDEFQQLRANQ
jgi:hypothetical protein